MRALGPASAVTAALLFGSFVALGKLAVSPPLAVSLGMNLVAGLSFLPFLIRRPLSRGSLPGLLAIGLFGGALAPTLVLVALASTAPALAAFLTTTEAAFTILIAYRLGERASRRAYAAMAGLAVGAALVSLPLGGGAVLASSLGALAMVLASLCWAVDNNLSRRLTATQDIPALVAAKCLVASAVLAPAAIASGGFVAADLPLLLFLGLAVHGAAILFFYRGLREIGAMRTGAIFTLSSVFGAVVGHLLFPQPLQAIQVAAGAGMVALALVLAIESSREPRVVPGRPSGGGKNLTKLP